MRDIKVLTVLTVLIIFLGIGLNGWSFTLPDPTDIVPGFGVPVPSASLHSDFYSYSLPILAFGYDFVNGGGTGPGNPYYVNSTPGAIKDGVVIGTGTSSNPANTNFPGMDNAYPTPDGGIMSIRIESGTQHMDGERALIYARTRHGSDDFRRAEHQQQILSAVAKKLTNPVYWPGVFRVLNQYMDTDMTVWDMLTIAPPILLNGGRFDQLVVDRDYILGTAQGHAIPNMEVLTPWIAERFD